MNFMSKEEYEEILYFFSKYENSKNIENAKLAEKLKKFFIKNNQIKGD